MKVIVTYIYPGSLTAKGSQYACRFVDSYLKHPPGMEHETVVVLNATKLTPVLSHLFGHLQNVRYLEHDDSGWDIGAFQLASRKNPDAHMMAFFGTSVYFMNQNWLRRMVEAYMRHGPGLYGVMGNRGDIPIGVYPHIRTTGFFMQPDLLNKFPYIVKEQKQRYEFEHGRTCLSNWVKAQGLPLIVVTKDGEYYWKDWDSIPNGYHRGDQSALLCGDRMNDPPFYPYEKRKNPKAQMVGGQLVMK